MKLQLKNHILSRINGALCHDNIKFSYEVYNKENLLCHVNSQSFFVDAKMSLQTIKQSALKCQNNYDN